MSFNNLGRPWQSFNFAAVGVCKTTPNPTRGMEEPQPAGPQLARDGGKHRPSTYQSFVGWNNIYAAVGGDIMSEQYQRMQDLCHSLLLDAAQRFLVQAHHKSKHHTAEGKPVAPPRPFGSNTTVRRQPPLL
jgi:hypothetical protein